MYNATRGNSQMAVINGKEGPPTSETIYIQHSTDGSHYGYFMARKPGISLMLDDRKYGPYTDANEQLAFSPDGRHTAWAIQRDKVWHLVVDGQEVAGNPLMGKPQQLRFASPTVLDCHIIVPVDNTTDAVLRVEVLVKG